MSLTPTVLLSSLKDFNKCNDDLSAAVKRTILEPLQSDMMMTTTAALREPLRRPIAPPGLLGNGRPQDIRTKVKQLAPLAMRVVNQNIDSLKHFKDWRRNSTESTKTINTIKHCLIDTSFYATTALQNMKPYSTLKPLDIEKTVSNLIGKLVDLGEWARALEELRKFRYHLASMERIQLDKTLTLNLTTGSLTVTQQRTFDTKEYSLSTSPTGSSDENNKDDQKESTHQHRLKTTPPTSPNRSLSPELVFVGGKPTSMSSWEEEMIQKYADLFTFPLNTNINDRSMILLVLAYQMNVIRSWCDVNDGILIKYIAILLDRPGNFIDWCKHLMSFDEVLAKKQFDLLQRHLSRTASKSAKFDDPLQTMAIQVLALRSSAYTDTVPLRSLCDRFVRLGISYEKATPEVKYDCLQKYCSDLLQLLQPSAQELPDLEAYFVFCEYYAYVSRKAKSYTGAIYGFTSMMQLVDDIISLTSSPSYYHVAYATHAKLSLCAAQMDSMIHYNTHIDITPLFPNINTCIQSLTNIIQNNDISNDSYTEQAMIKVNKSVHSIRHSSNRLFEMSLQSKNTIDKDSSSPTPWDQTISSMASTLQQCSILILLHLDLIKKKGWINKGTRSAVTPSDILLIFVDIMVLLAKIYFDANDDNTYYQAYDYLASAEQICSEHGLSSGYRWISATYYTLGAAMVTSSIIPSAVYPLRKACTLLEKDPGRISSDAGKLQLAKRYEVFGTCCQKNGDFEAAIKAFRMALKRVPATTVDTFTTGSERMSISRMIEQQPLVPKLMDRFLRSSIGEHEQRPLATELLDTSLITPIQQCVLYECELQILFKLSSRQNLMKQQNWFISSLLQHYTTEHYPIRRTRILLSKIRMLHHNGLATDDSIRSAIGFCLEAQELLKSKDYGFDSDLLTYRRHYLALTCSWLGILRRELNEISPKTFVMALHHWGKLMKKVNPITSNPTPKEELEQVCLQVDDLDSLYDHLRILVDLFGLIGHSSLQINTLRLLLKLNNGLREATADHISDSAIIITDIGRIYSELGYSGKAGLEFAKVKKILSKHRCSGQAELHYFVQYSQHLSTLGEYEESQTIFNKSGTSWEIIRESEAFNNNSMRLMKQQAVKTFLISDSHLTRSSLSLYKESLDTAISDATSSYQVLSQFLKSIKKKTQYNPNENIFLTTEKTGKIKEPEPLSIAANDLIFKEYQWTVAMKMGLCFQRLACLHMTRGTWRDAQYYLSQGKQLGERIKSNAMVYQFLILLSDSYLRTGQLDKSKSSLEAANDIQPTGPNYLREDAQMKMAVANIDANQQFLDESIQSYTAVDDLLQQMMDPVYITTLEKLTESDEDFERQLAIARGTHLLEAGLEESLQYECQALEASQGETAIHKALVLAQKGLLSIGLKTLERFENGGVPTKADLLKAAGAHIRLLIVKDELKNHANLTFMENNVLTLPSLRISSVRGIQPSIHRNKTAHSLRLAQDGVSQALERLVATHRKCARTEKVAVVRRLCYEAGCGMFLRNQVSIGENMVVNNYAALGGYYLEMAKGIGLRREMQHCLEQKLCTPLQMMTSDLVWPKPVVDLGQEEESKQEQANRPLPLSSSRTVTHLMNLRDIYRQEHDLADGEFQSYFIDILPPHWTVCSLFLDGENDLYVARYRAGEPPFVVKLPFHRGDERRRHCRRSPPGASRGAPSGLSYKQARTELQDIIQLSDETIHSSKATLNKKDVEDWWMTRSLLDTRLKKLLEQMEMTWIGGFKGLLCGRHPICETAFVEFQQAMQQIVLTNVYGATTQNRRGLELDDRTLHMILQLGSHPTNQEVEDIVFYLLACYEHQHIQVDYSVTERMTQQIRHTIKAYHDKASASGINTLQCLPNEHLILIPDQQTQMFPLESMPTLRCQAVSRLPCMSFLRDRILYAISQQDQLDGWKDITIDASRTYYLLNPSGDLKHTQATFEPIFERMHTWEGHTQRKPSEIECRSILKQKDLYMYFGHSAGQSFLRGQIIRQLPRCPVTLLMGCSSGALQSQGEYDPYGYILHYLMGGSPAVVANLWDVTDKSIDQVSKKMMERWGLFKNAHGQQQQQEENHPSLVQALTNSREECQLPYLIGAASVVYGVPVYVL